MKTSKFFLTTLFAAAAMTMPSQAAFDNLGITMSDFVSTGTLGEGVQLSSRYTKDSTVYDFTGAGAITGITNKTLLDVLKSGSGYLTIAAWVNPTTTNGVQSLFSYGAMSDGFKFAQNGSNIQFTTKGVKDMSAVGTVSADAWNLLAVSINLGNVNESSRLFLGEKDGGYYSMSFGAWKDPAESNQRFGIGSGNSDGNRELFAGSIANLTFFTSDALVNNSVLATAMGAAPVFVPGKSLIWKDAITKGDWDFTSKNWVDDAGKEQVFSSGDSVTFNVANAEIALKNSVDVDAMAVLETMSLSGEGVVLKVASPKFSIGEGKSLMLAKGVTVDLGSNPAADTGLNVVQPGLYGTGTVKVTNIYGHGSVVKLSNFNGTLDFTGNFNWGSDFYSLGKDATIKLTSHNGSSLWSGGADGNITQNVLFGSDYKISLNYGLVLTGKVESSKKLTIEGAKSLTFKENEVNVGEIKHSGNGSTLNFVKSNAVIGKYVGISGDKNVATVNVDADSSVAVSGDFILVNENNAAKGTLELSGKMSVGGTFWVARDGVGVANIKNGGTLSVNTLKFGTEAAAWVSDNPDNKSSTLNLMSGGTLVVGAGGIVTQGAMNSERLRFLGGTFGTSAESLDVNLPDLELVLEDGTTSIVNSGKYVDGAFSGSEGAEITITNVISGDGSLKLVGSGTLKLSGENTYTGGTIVESGTLEALSAKVLGAGAVTVSGEKGKLVAGSGLAVSTLLVKAGSAEINGLAEIQEGVFVSGGTLTVRGSLKAEEISVSGGRLSIATLAKIEDLAAVGNIKASNITVSGGTLADLSFEESAEAVLELESGELSGVNLSAGATLVFYAEEYENEEGEPEPTYLNKNPLLTISNGFTLDSNAKIDLSNLLFEKPGEQYALIKVGDGIFGGELAITLGATARVDKLIGEFLCESVEGEDWVVFKIGEDKENFALTWDNTNRDKYWTKTSIQGQELGGRPLYFGKLQGGATEEEVLIGNGASANNVMVVAGASDTYIFKANGEVKEFAVEALQVQRGRLEVAVAMLTKGGITLSGGTLVGSVAGALNVGTDAKIDVLGGTLSLQAKDATNAKTINLGAGATLELTANGAISELAKENGVEFELSVNGTEDKHATITWNGSTDSLASKMKVLSDSHINFNVLSEKVEWKDGTASNTSASYYKTGAGTLFLNAPTALTGNFDVTEGILSLGRGNDGKPVFAGDISVSGENSVLRLENAYSFGTVKGSANPLSLSLSDGARMELFGESGGDDTQVLANVHLILGNNVKIGNVEGNDATPNNNGIVLNSDSSVSVSDGAKAEIAVTVQLEDGANVSFDVGSDAELTLREGLINRVNVKDASASLTKEGAGTLVLSGNSDLNNAEVYSGETLVNGGTLRFTGATPGAGAIKIADGATLEIDATGRTEFAGGVGDSTAASGTGNINVVSGKANFLSAVNVASASVNSGAELLIGKGDEEKGSSREGSLKGNLFLGGIVGGNGTFEGEVEIGSGAGVYAGEYEEFVFKATSLKGAEALTKSGDGTVVLDSALTSGFDLTLGAGTLASNEDQSINSVIFSGGLLGGDVAEWSVNDIAVNEKGGTILAALELNSFTGKSSLVLGGDLKIGGETGALTANADTLELSSKGGSLIVATTVEDGNEPEYFVGGKLSANHLKVDASLKKIQLGGARQDGNGAADSEIAMKTGVFHGAVEIDGANGKLSVSESIVFENGANIENYTGDPNTVINGRLELFGSGNVTVDVVAGSVNVGELSGKLNKIGAGTLKVGTGSISDLETLEIREGRVEREGEIDEEMKVLVSGERSVLKIGSLSDISVCLENGATYIGNLEYGVLDREVVTSLTDSTISGNLEFSSIENGDVTVGNMEVDGDVSFGSSTVPTDELEPGEHKVSPAKMSGKIKILGGATAMDGVDTLRIYGEKGLSFENFDLDYDSIGSELSIVNYRNLAYYAEDITVEISENSVILTRREPIREIEAPYILFDSSEQIGDRQFHLILEEGALKVVADGTFVWNKNVKNWNTTDATWTARYLAGNLENQKLTAGAYVDFEFNGSDNKISVKESVAMSGIVFNGNGSKSVFEVNFNGGKITDYTKEGEDTKKASVQILSGYVEFNDSSVGLTGENTFTGNVTILESATLSTNNTKLLGKENDILLSGTLSFRGTSGTLDSDFVASGPAATVSVENSSAKLTLAGTVSGTQLEKSGDGTLVIAGAASLDSLLIDKGAVRIENASGSAVETGIRSFVIEANANDKGLTFAKNDSLGMFADLTLAAGKQVTFEGSETWLNSALLNGDGSKISFATVGRFKVGGTYMDDEGKKSVVWATIEKAEQGTSTLTGNLQLQGGDFRDETAGATINVAKNGTLTVTGDVADADNEDAGKFTFEKAGEGALKIEGVFKTGALVSLEAGTLTVGGETALTGTLQVLSSATLELKSGGSIGTLLVQEDLTLNAGGELTVSGNSLVAGKLALNVNEIRFDGKENTYSEIEVNAGATLSIGSTAEVFSGEKIELGKGATLSVAGKLSGSSGILDFSENSKISLEGGEIEFSEITTSESNLLFNIDGEGVVVATGSVGSNNTIGLAEKVELQLRSGEETTPYVGALTGSGTVRKLGEGELSVSGSSDEQFTGSVIVDEGALRIKSGSLGQAKLTISQNAEITLERSAVIGAWEGNDNAVVAGALVGGAGTLAVSGKNNTLSFSSAIGSDFSGTLEARDAGTLVYNAFVAGEARNVALTNGGWLSVEASGDAETLAMGTLAVSGQSNSVKLVAGKTLEIGGMTIADAKDVSNLTFVGDGAATISETIAKSPNSKALFDISTGADFTGTLTLSGENNAHRDTIINSGTVVFKTNASATGTGKIVLNSSENATVRFDGFAADAVLKANISGKGTVEGTSGTLSGLTGEFSGVVRAVKGSAENSTFTVDKSGMDLLSETSPITFAAGEGATLVIKTDGAGSDLVDTVEMGNATFGDGAGTIRLALGAAQTLEVENANACAAGTLEVASGTLKVVGSGDLGSASVNIGSGAKLNVAANVLRNAIAGEGTLVKNTSGTSYVGGKISANTEVSIGALAVAEFDEKANVFVRNGTLEFSKTLNENGETVGRSAGDVKLFNANYSADVYARFSHEASTASSLVGGTFAWKNSPGTLALAGGGEASRIEFKLFGGKVFKIGSGKWTLSNFSDIASFELETGGGTLALENYVGSDTQALVLGSDAVLEIASFDRSLSADETVVRGIISGAGTLAVSSVGGDVSLALTNENPDEVEWGLQVRKAASVVVRDASELSAAYVDIQANPAEGDFGGTLTFDSEAKTIELKNRVFSVGGNNRDVAAIQNGRILVRGGTTVDLTDSTFKLGGVLDVENGLVKVASVGRITPTAGVVNVQENGALEIGLKGLVGEISAIAGNGKISFVAGTTSLKNINMAQAVEDFNKDFTGTVSIAGEATVVLESGTNFGNAKSVDVGGVLKVAQYSKAMLKNLVGAGTLEIANVNHPNFPSSAPATTVYGSSNSGFTGKINITRGRLEVAPSVFAALSNEVNLGESAASGLALSNASDAATELGALAGKQNISGKGSLFLSASEAGFALADGNAFGYGSQLYIDPASSLAMGIGATVSSNLYVAKGATLDLTKSVAAPVAARSTGSASGSATRNVAGNLTLAGTLKTVVPSDNSAVVHAAGAATIKSTATVEVDGNSAPGDAFTLVATDTKNGVIENGALFRTASGERLSARVSDDASKIIVSFDAWGLAGAVPAGLEELNDTILTNTDSAIYKAVYWSGTDAEQYARLANFSPISFAGALELSTGLTQLENDLLRQRLEQRRYDRAFAEAKGTIKAYANAIGSSTETSEGEEKSANYDLSHYGAVAGFDVVVSEDFQVGVSFTYDFGKAKVHGNGGKHETDTARVNMYGMAMLDEVSYFGFGLGFGVTGLETSRRNELETLSGDASGTDISLTTTLGRMFVLAPQAGLHFSPYIGLDYTFSRFSGFAETGGTETALDVGDLERNSLRGIVGATLNWLPSEDWRFSLEAAFRHEFLDTDTDIDAKFIGGTYAGMSASSTAYFSGEDTVSVGPRVEYRLNANWSVSAGYTFESDLDNATTHSGNVGVRCKF